MFVFLITQPTDVWTLQCHPKQKGELRLVIDFGANPGTNLTIFLYGEFENLLEINGN